MRNFVKHKSILLTACVGVIGACAARPPAPAWVDAPAAADVPAGWWSAVGRGATRAEAEDAALIRLAQRVESRVRAREKYQEGAPLDRRALIETDARLLGAEILETYEDAATAEHAALAAFAPDRAARLLAGRVRDALAHQPPRLGAEIHSWIEQGAALDPSAADWDALRRQHREALAVYPPSRLDAPSRVAAELRASFGPSATSATWSVAPVASYATHRMARWTLEAVVAGEPRRWTGVATGPDLASARLRAEVDAAGALRRERELDP
jgi:hypothetical protein